MNRADLERVTLNALANPRPASESSHMTVALAVALAVLDWVDEVDDGHSYTCITTMHEYEDADCRCHRKPIADARIRLQLKRFR